MQAIKRIPKILETLDQMRENYDIYQVFQNYKKNTMKTEVSELINQYETTIKTLKLEIASLKSSIESSKFIRTPQMSKFDYSPQKPKLQDLMQTANSVNMNLFKSVKLDNLPISSIYKKKGFEQSQFQEDEINQYQEVWQNNQSKFEEASRKRKQKEQQLRLYLESGKKNMNVTTELFMEAVGKNRREQNSLIQDEEKQDQETSNRKQQSLNKSLAQICESLNTSFVSQKARSEKKKKMASIQKEIKTKQKIQQQTAKMLKDKGIKSLLQRLRNNVEISPHKTPQKITSSKLLSTKTKQKDNLSNTSRKSKVMINPVPVDIVSRSKAANRSKDSFSSPGLKPQSILKRSSTILSGHDLTI